MVVNNTCDSIGDILTIYSQGLLSGTTLSISSFTDIIVGETVSRFFTKSFRYSLDGITYTDWATLDNPTLATVSGDPNGLIYFEFKYTRVGTDTTGLLEFQGITLIGTITVQVCTNTASIDTIFEELCCNDALTNQVCQNLLEKIYYTGIVPAFIERGEGTDDRDYIDLWSAICVFFAMHISFANNFDFIFQNKKILKEYLKQKNIYFNQEVLFGELQFLSDNFIDEIRKRGTKQIWLKKDHVLLDGTINPIDGEWLRLLCRNVWDEFLVENIENKHLGFCIDNSWFLYNGTYLSRQLNKTKENEEEFQSLSNYSLLDAGSLSIAVDSDSKEVLQISPSTGQLVGLGFDLSSPPVGVLPSENIIVDSELDYEITFFIKRNATGFSSYDILHFGVLGFNRNDVYIPSAFMQMDAASLFSNEFFADTSFRATKIEEQYYFVRGIIYAKFSTDISDPNYLKLNNKLGKQLRFNHLVDVHKIIPCLYSESLTSNATYQIKDFKVRPLIRGKNIMTTKVSTHAPEFPNYVSNPQFLQSGNLIMSWMKNNNEERGDIEINDLIQDKLIPYSTKLIGINLTKQTEDKQLLGY